VLEPLLTRDPDYLHARFLLAAAYGCGGEPAKSVATLQPAAATALGAVLSVSFRELARTLAAAGQEEFGRRLLRCSAPPAIPVVSSASHTRLTVPPAGPSPL
jgi:hypothetical protein